jgi:3-dehydroquinate dehydratase type I
MLDLARGPFIVGVADRAEALVECAATDPLDRPFDLVEARVDLFATQRLDGPAAEACRQLEAGGTPVLVTIRSAGQGGQFNGGDEDRLARFRQALAVASWADVEDDASIIAAVAGLVAGRPEGRLVVSHHDFSATPPLDTLCRWVDACHAAAPNAIAKVATAVRTPGDGETLRALLAARRTLTAVIGMGEHEGRLRVDLAAAGSLLAYGFLSRSTAPGQLSAVALHERLRAASATYADRRGAGSAAI